MEILWIFAIVFVLAIVLGVAKGINDQKLATDTRQRVQSKYQVDEIYVSSVDRSLVAISFDDHQIILGAGNYDAAYDFAQIASVEVVENGATVTQTNRASQVLGAAVGGLAFGALGAVVGGLSGSSRSRGRLRGISLKVTVDDRLRPVHMICFLQSPDKKGLDADGLQATQARGSIDRIHAHIINAMREVQEKTSAAPVAFSADELQKIWEMKQAGILTEDEFVQQKTRLLGQSGQSKGASAAFATLPQPTSYSVVLVNPGRQKIPVIKAIRDVMPYLGLREAKDLVDGAPTVLATGISRGDAEKIRQTLVVAGALSI